MGKNKKKIKKLKLFYDLQNVSDFDYQYIPNEMNDMGRNLIIEVSELPFAGPRGYSLSYERSELLKILDNNHFINHKISKADNSAIAKDWNCIGRDLNDAIREYARRIKQS